MHCASFLTSWSYFLGK